MGNYAGMSPVSSSFVEWEIGLRELFSAEIHLNI